MNLTGKKLRVNKYDNLKGFAIILIVLGHFINFTNDNPLHFIHNFFHLIHLPIFFFVAGYFSKISLDQPEKSFKRLLIPYIIFCFFYWLFKKFILIEPSNTPFLYPGRGLWFLISLFTMKMMLPILDKLKYPVLFTFILALFVGFYDFYEFAFSRTLCYLPIFLIGFYYEDFRGHISRKYRNVYNFLSKKTSIIFITIVTIIFLSFIAKYIPFDVIILKNRYSAPRLYYLAIRAVIICLGIIFTLIMNKLMFNSNNFLTKIGRNSMAVYVLHLFLIVPVWNFLKYFYPTYPIICSVSSFILAFLTVHVLSRDFVTKYLNKFTDGIYNLIVKID